MDVRKLIAAALALPVFAAGAESGYIAESLKIGIHENASLKSTILQLVPSGTELEILQTDDQNRAQVRTADGVEGWVDGRYLKQGIPPQRRVQELEDELLQTASELAGARDQVAELQFQLNKAMAEAAALQAGSKPATASAGNGAMTSETLREMQTLAEENQGLKQRVAELEAVQAMAVERAQAAQPTHESGPRNSPPADASGSFDRYTAILRWPVWKQIFLASALLLMFAIGGFIVDWDVRRRHGGFRV